MKIRIAFAAIAVVALASAFTTRKLATHNYQIFSQDSNQWNVENVDRSEGTANGQYTCTASSNACVVGTSTTTPTSDGLGNFYILKSATDAAQSNGTYAQH